MRFRWIEKEILQIEKVDAGELAKMGRYEQRRFFKRLGHRLSADCQIMLDGLPEEEREGMTAMLVEAMMQGMYHFGREALKECHVLGIYGARDKLACYPEHTVYLVSAVKLQDAADVSCLLGRCTGYARMLGDLPGNYLHVEDFAAYARELSKHIGISIEIHGTKELKEMGCGGILAVNQASNQEANMIVLSYEGTEGPVTALVGKGILFDSGGYHLKSIEGMEGMKYDMCGAADVLSLMEYIARSNMKVNVTAVIPAAENVISPEGVKMGDVLTTMSGKTVEVYNTDAEGRLLLCDALTYACEIVKAETVLDFATLTYSCKNALGDEITGVFCNDDKLYGLASAGAKLAGEKIWRLPLDESYHSQLRWSKTADIANYAPGKGGGAGVAACFLEEFIEAGVKWAHFDMVGPAVLKNDTTESQSGATGAMISTAAAMLRESQGTDG